LSSCLTWTEDSPSSFILDMSEYHSDSHTGMNTYLVDRNQGGTKNIGLFVYSGILRNSRRALEISD
jgi:hypothetical protein